MNGREAVGRLQKRLSGRSGLSSRLKKYKWVGLVLLVGLLLLAWPAGKENQAETAAETPQTFDLAATEARLSDLPSDLPLAAPGSGWVSSGSSRPPTRAA